MWPAFTYGTRNITGEFFLVFLSVWEFLIEKHLQGPSNHHQKTFRKRICDHVNRPNFCVSTLSWGNFLRQGDTLTTTRYPSRSNWFGHCVATPLDRLSLSRTPLRPNLEWRVANLYRALILDQQFQGFDLDPKSHCRTTVRRIYISRVHDASITAKI